MQCASTESLVAATLPPDEVGHLTNTDRGSDGVRARGSISGRHYAYRVSEWFCERMSFDLMQTCDQHSR